jgi:hypothetical protein
VDEVQEFCRRVIGPGARADAAAEQAHAEGHRDRIAMLAAAARACRERADEAPAASGSSDEASNGAPVPSGLTAAVARELAAAVARLPERQREALALRELLRLSYQQVSGVMQIDRAAVAPLLARARLRLRAARRATEIDPAGAACPDRDRALRILACRQDSEPLSQEDDEWIMSHLAACAACDMAHAAMLEASVCYRAWPGEAADEDAAGH